MKEILKGKISEFKDVEQKSYALREGLQHLILKILDDLGYFKTLSFLGGTCLRVVYDIRRFSEDLDFSLQRPDDPHFDFSKMIQDLKKQLAIYELDVDIKAKEVGAVRNCFFRFKEILYEFNLSPLQSQNLSIKLEVDTHPPLAARLESDLIQKDFLFTVVHHDLSTLCAGKILAFLYRKYTKGRDIYDLIWFLTRKTAVNKEFFENGLFQATGEKGSWSKEQLIENLSSKMEGLNFNTIADDVKPFLDDPYEARLFDRPLIVPVIQNIDFN